MTILSSTNYLSALENLADIAIALTEGRNERVHDLMSKIEVLYNNEAQFGDPDEADRIEGIYLKAESLIETFN